VKPIKHAMAPDPGAGVLGGLRTAIRIAAVTSVLSIVCAQGSAQASAEPVIDTTITGGPGDASVIERDSANFSFSATRDGASFPGAAFHCSIDEGPYQPCASPLALEHLTEGGHSLSVYAEDAEALVADPEPAHRAFVYYDLEEACAGPEGPPTAEAEEGAEEEAEVEAFSAEARCTETSRGHPPPPEECLLRTMDARVLAPASQSRIRLMVRYAISSPADVVLSSRLGGASGPLTLGTTTQRLAGNGVLRQTERLSRAAMEKVRAARRFTVTIDVQGVPSYCARFQTRRLTVRRAAHGQVSWVEAEPTEAGGRRGKARRRPAS
jgi:hypothetical protein